MKKLHIITLRQAPQCIENLLSFRASNLTGILDAEKGEYMLFSYATLICKINCVGEITVNRLNEYFSRSTSRHQSIIKRALGL